MHTKSNKDKDVRNVIGQWLYLFGVWAEYMWIGTLTALKWKNWKSRCRVKKSCRDAPMKSWWRLVSERVLSFPTGCSALWFHWGFAKQNTVERAAVQWLQQPRERERERAWPRAFSVVLLQRSLSLPFSTVFCWEKPHRCLEHCSAKHSPALVKIEHIMIPNGPIWMPQVVLTYNNQMIISTFNNRRTTATGRTMRLRAWNDWQTGTVHEVFTLNPRSWRTHSRLPWNWMHVN